MNLSPNQRALGPLACRLQSRGVAPPKIGEIRWPAIGRWCPGATGDKQTRACLLYLMCGMQQTLYKTVYP